MGLLASVGRNAGAYLWTRATVRRAAGAAEREPLERRAAPRPPGWLRGGDGGMAAALRRLAPDPLLCAHVRQGWLAASGEVRLLRFGVRTGEEGFVFQAWLDGDEVDERLVVIASRTPAGIVIRNGSRGEGAARPRAGRARGEPGSAAPRDRGAQHSLAESGLVSVILPARDVSSTIAEQLRALARQSHVGPWELVLVDDGSRDGTAEVALEQATALGLEIRLVRLPRPRGSSAARNAGARAARGELLAFCDADDVVAPTWLAELVAAAGSADQVGGFIDSYLIDPSQRVSRGLPTDRLPDVAGLPYAPGGNMAIRAEALAAVGGFDEGRRRNVDVELSARLRRAGFTLAFAPRAVVHIRHRSTAAALVGHRFGAGISTVRLYRDLRADGIRRDLLAIAGAWGRLLRGAPALISGSRERRLDWLARAAFRAGRLAGSVRYRTLYP